MGREELVDRFLCADGNGVAARRVVADEGKVLILQLGVCGHLLIVGGHTEHVLRLVLPDQAAELGGVKVRDDNDGQAQNQRQMDAARIAVGDEGGHDVHQGLPLLEQPLVGRELHRNGVEVAVGEHNALGRAGGAAGVNDDTGVLRVILLGRGAGVLAVRDELLPHQHVGFVAVAVGIGGLVADGQMQRQGVRRGDHDHSLHMGALGGLIAALIRHIQAEQQVGVHLLDVFVDAFGAVAGVHQIQGGPDAVRCIESVNDLRGHHTDDGDDVALFDAHRAESGGGLLDVHDEVGVGDFPAIVFHRRLAQAILVLPTHIVEGRTFRQGLVDELGIVVFEPRACL